MSIFSHRKGREEALFFIAGPCVIESRDNALRTADALARIASALDILLVYKS